MTYHLAIDIGASSGRHILGHIESGRLVLEEVYRFEEYLKEENGSLIWDIEKLVREVKAGIEKCSKIGKIPGFYRVVSFFISNTLHTLIFKRYAVVDKRRNFFN